MCSKFKYTLILTKEFLLKEYIKKQKSISQIAKETGIDWSTIKRYAQDNKIKLRTHKEQAAISSKGSGLKYEKILTKKFLVKNYIKRKKSIKRIAQELCIFRGTIVRYLRKFKIPVRSSTEQKKILYPPKEFKLTKKCVAFLDGLLLGDGSIPRHRYEARAYTQGCKYKVYLLYIRKRFKAFGIETSPINGRWIKDTRCKNGGYKLYFLQTRRYGTFETVRKRWYGKDGKKIIPKDVRVTQDSLSQFYLCDGNHYKEIRLCVGGFRLKDVKFLKKLIERKVDISLRLVTPPSLKGHGDLAIKKSEVIKFLNFIKRSPVKCYEYKWVDGAK